MLTPLHTLVYFSHRFALSNGKNKTSYELSIDFTLVVKNLYFEENAKNITDAYVWNIQNVNNKMNKKIL